MNTLKKSIVIASIAGGTLLSTAVQAGLSSNVGFVSEYVFRGIGLGDAGAYAGLDFEESGFYAGVWAIDDGGGANDGLETDFYAGYVYEADNWSIGGGYSRYEYTYTSDFEDEFNFYAGVAGFALELALGNDDDGDAGDADYEFIALSYGFGDYGILVGQFEYDEDTDESGYRYAELSASKTFEGFDFGATLGVTFDGQDAAGEDTSSGDGYLVLDVSKSFDLM